MVQQFYTIPLDVYEIVFDVLGECDHSLNLVALWDGNQHFYAMENFSENVSTTTVSFHKLWGEDASHHGMNSSSRDGEKTKIFSKCGGESQKPII